MGVRKENTLFSTATPAEYFGRIALAYVDESVLRSDVARVLPNENSPITPLKK